MPMRFPSTILATLLAVPLFAAEPKPLFDGKSLAGWEGDEKTWRVEDGAIVGGSLDVVVPRNEFLCTTKTYGDFELKLKFKLLGDKDKANAGVQFRTKRIPKHHEVIGYQADIGKGYWGALYDESRRKKILAGPKAEEAAKLVKAEDWNEYTIRAQGPWIQLWLNGTKTVNYIEKDEKIEATGVIALQVHGGAKSKVMYKDITIEDLPPLRERPKE
jgi:3-keto-disaccharide hydrolase